MTTQPVRTPQEQTNFETLASPKQAFRCVVLKEKPLLMAEVCCNRQEAGRSLDRKGRSAFPECLACGDGEFVASKIGVVLPPVPTSGRVKARVTPPTTPIYEGIHSENADLPPPAVTLKKSQETLLVKAEDMPDVVVEVRRKAEPVMKETKVVTCKEPGCKNPPGTKTLRSDYEGLCLKHRKKIYNAERTQKKRVKSVDESEQQREVAKTMEYLNDCFLVVVEFGGIEKTRKALEAVKLLRGEG